MALLKKDRNTLNYEGEQYFWRVGQEKDHFATLAVQAPSGRIWTRILRVRGHDGSAKSITPQDAILLIEDRAWEANL